MDNAKSDYKLIKNMISAGGVLSIGLGLLIGIIGGIASVGDNFDLLPVVICWFSSFSAGLFALISSSKITVNKKQGFIFMILSVVLSIAYLVYVLLYGNGTLDGGNKHKVFMMTFFVEGTSALLFVSSLITCLTLKESKGQEK